MALDALKKSLKTLRARHLKEPEIEEGASCPASVVSIIDPMLTKMTEVKTKVSSGEKILTPAIDALDDNQLKLLAAIYPEDEMERTSYYSEDRVVSSAYAMLKELDTLDRSMEYLRRTKNQLLETYMSAFISEFSVLKSGEMVFNNRIFKKLIYDTIKYRQGIRRGMEQPQEDLNVSDAQERRCAIM